LHPASAGGVEGQLRDGDAARLGPRSCCNWRIRWGGGVATQRDGSHPELQLRLGNDQGDAGDHLRDGGVARAAAAINRIDRVQGS
jgi:hypothetical protein